MSHLTTDRKRKSLGEALPQSKRDKSSLTCDLSSVVATLREHGVAVLPNVLNSEECVEMASGMWDHYEYVCEGRLKRDDPRTWKRELQGTLMLNHGMLSQFHHSGHMQAVWDVRGHSKVQAAYKTFFKTDELTVSFDGCSFGLPPEDTGIGWHNKNWLHLDQGWGTMSKTRTHGRRRAVQSWVTAYDIEEGDGTLQVLLGSHKLHEEFAKVFGHTKHSNDWYKLESEEVQWYLDKGCKLHNIECGAGSQVFWDSRTVHAGRAPLKGRQHPKNRFVIYICFSPRSWLSPKFAAKKREYLARGRQNLIFCLHGQGQIGRGH